MTLATRSFHWTANPDGTLDGSYPTGTKPPDPVALSWSNAAAGLTAAGINVMLTGTPFSHNVRQYLSGDDAATAVITLVLITGDDPVPSGWTAPGSGSTLSYNAVAAKAGSFRLRATASGSSADSSTVAWSCTTAPPVGNANFTIAAGAGSSTFDGTARGVQPGDIIEFAAGTHGARIIQNVIGTAGAGIITIRGPQTTGQAVINSTSATFILIMENCKYFKLDGETSSSNASCPIRADGKRHGIKITSTPSYTGMLKFRTGGRVAYDNSHHCTLRYLELDGGWIVGTAGQTGIGFQTNDEGALRANYPAGTYQEDITIEHNYVHNFPGEGSYIGSNVYKSVRPGMQAAVPNRGMKIRYNWFVDCGGNGISGKSWFGGQPGTGADGPTDNSVHHNVVIRCGIDTTAAVNGRASIGFQSCKTSTYNNWVESGGGVGITCWITEGLSVSDPNGVYVYEIYNNVVLKCSTIETTRAGIRSNVYSGTPTIPASLYPTCKWYNNTCTQMAQSGPGIQMANEVKAGSFIANNVSVDNGGTNISYGGAPSNAAGNKTDGTATANFVDIVGSYEAGTVDYHLQAASAVVGGSVLGTDVATTDFDGDTRSLGTADKGAYEHP